MNDTIKTATVDQEFESAFFQLAYDKLQSKLFNLLPFLVGFETVTKSDDNSKAVGVFGFKSQNEQVLLVPVFFINGKVKEPELLYSKNNNQYYPLNEDFANMFLKDDVTGLGRVSNEKRQVLEQNMGGVDYRDLVFPPRTGRISYASVIDYIKEEDNNVKQAAWDCMAENPDFLESMLRFYSENEIASALVPKVAAEKISKVQVVGPKDGEKIPQEKKLEVASKGYGIVDTRPETEKSSFGPFQYPAKFSNPTESGFYSYLTHRGTLRYGLVLIKPFTWSSQLGTGEAYVIDLSASSLGHMYQAKASSIFIREQVKVADFSQVYKMMQDPAEGQPDYNNKYLLINEGLRSSEAFTIVQNFKDQHGLRRLVISKERELNVCPRDCYTHNNEADLKTSKPANTRFYKEPKHNTVTLVFTKLEGEKPDFKGPIVYVPKGYKLLPINTKTWVDDKINYAIDSEEAREKKRQKAREREEALKEGQPGGLYCLTAALREQHIFPMSVRTNGSEFFAKVKDVTKKYDNAMLAKIGMVVDFGLDEKVGNELIDSVKDDKPVTGELKLAYTGDYVPQVVDESAQAGELGMPTTYGLPYFNVAPTSGNTYTGDPTRRNMAAKDESGSQGGPGQDIQQAIGMAQAGQKQIFDTQSIAALAKYINPSDKVISYIPDFVGTVDKLGRILFMVHWDIDKFQKMYGYDELPELVELVKNVFKNLGDLIIFLKRKFPDISINSNESMPDKL